MYPFEVFTSVRALHREPRQAYCAEPHLDIQIKLLCMVYLMGGRGKAHRAGSGVQGADSVGGYCRDTLAHASDKACIVLEHQHHLLSQSLVVVVGRQWKIWNRMRV